MEIPKNCSFPGSAWERTAPEALPRAGAFHQGDCRLSLQGSAFPGGERVNFSNPVKTQGDVYAS